MRIKLVIYAKRMCRKIFPPAIIFKRFKYIIISTFLQKIIIREAPYSRIRIHIYNSRLYSQHHRSHPYFYRNFNLAWSCRNFRSVKVCISYFIFCSSHTQRIKSKYKTSRVDFTEYFFVKRATLWFSIFRTNRKFLQLMRSIHSHSFHFRNIIKIRHNKNLHVHLMRLETHLAKNCCKITFVAETNDFSLLDRQ